MMRHWLISFMAACTTGLCAAAGGSPLDEYLLFETVGDDCYADGSPLWEGECYALVWRNGDAATRVDGLFNSDGTVANPSTTKILAVFPAAVQTNFEGNVYSCARRSWALMNPMDMTMWEKRGGVLSLFVFDTRRWNAESHVWELSGCDVEERTVAAIRRYGLVTDLEDIRRGLYIGIFEWDTFVHGTSFVTSDELTLFGDVTDQYSGTTNRADGVSDELVISLDANGGEPVPATMRTANGTCGALPGASRSGHMFVGWFTAATGGTRVTPDTVVTNDVTYYARWTAFAVEFNGRGGTGSMPKQDFVYDEPQALTSNAFVRAGYRFAGWATEVDGKAMYADGAVVSNLTAEVGGTVTLYAVWAANEYTVVFDKGDQSATGTMSDQTMTYDQEAALDGNRFARTGYTFAGWADGDGASAAKYADGAVVSNLTAEAGGTVTLYAQWTANTYTVDFNERGGEGTMDDQPMTYDQEAALYSNLFTRVGYTFLGWTDDEDELEEVLYYDGVVVSNLTDEADGEYDLYAVWAANAYAVKFNANGGEGTMDEQGFLYDEAKRLAGCEFVRDGYAFAGWADAKDAVAAMYADGAVVSNLTAEAGATVTLYAVWTQGDNTVTFDANGGTADETSRAVKTDEKLGALPTAGRTGYALAGWFTAPAGGEAVTANTVVKGDVTYFAQWTANEYTVAFNGQGGTGAMSGQEFTYDAPQVLTSNAFVRTGYGFAGWATEVDGKAMYADGEVVSNLTAEDGGTVTLYAVWAANEYTVRFDANGGAGTMSDQPMAYDQEAALDGNRFARTGYTFAGWAGGEGASAAKYADGAVVSNLTAEAGGTVTLYAQWTANAYTVDFNERGGEGAMEGQPMTYDQEATLYSNLFTRVGYAFLGWTDDEDELEEVLYYDGVVVSNLTVEANGEYDLYAVWAANAYAVKFNANGGEGTMDEQVFLYDEAKRLTPVDFDREGYGFAGWATAADGEVVYADCQLVSNLTAVADGVYELFAVWMQGENDVRFDANGGTASFTRRSVKTDDPVGELPEAERTGYAFEGWFTAREGGSRISSETVITEATTFYAQWSRIEWDGKVENDWLKVTCAQDAVALGLGEEVATDAYRYFAVDSGSAATLKVSGLPTGVKFDAKTGKMSGAATKKGVFYVTVAASNKSKFSQTKVMVVKVDGAEPDDRDEIGLNGMVLSNLVVGTEIPVGLVTIPSGASASGLPKGLKVVKQSVVDELGTVCDSIAGVPTKGGKCTIKVTEKKSGKTTLLNVIVADPGSKYITVKASDGGSATKSGVYAAGSTLKLSAKAGSKNTVFVGWTNEAGDWIRPAGADARAATLSTVVGEATPACFTACFEPASQDAARGVAVVSAADVWTFDEQDGPFEFLFKVESDSLPKVAIKPIPTGFAFNGAKDIVVGEDGAQYYRLVVKDAAKTKPGVYDLSFNVGNASVKQAVVKSLALVVRNKRSGLYDLDYENPYLVSVGVGDASAYPAFTAPAGAKVAVSGLPAGLKYRDGKITGVATKAGVFTVTITTTVGKQKLVDTVFVSVSELPAQLVGTFNGAVSDSADAMTAEKLVLTATAAGKLTAKVGSVSLKASGWNAFSNGCAYAKLEKAPYALDLVVDTNAWDTLQVSGRFAEQTVWAQRNPFGKAGKGHENSAAHALAADLAALGKVALSAVRDEASGLWRLAEAADGQLAVQVQETGEVKISGKLGDLSASGSTVLTVCGGRVSANFVVGKGDKKAVLEILFAEDGVTGTAVTK